MALHFHPDRIAGDGRTVARALLDEGRYLSQFRTGISNGGLTARPGGDRDKWEERLFGGAYQQVGVAPGERPTYGGLDLVRHPDGPCPRFGSCRLQLRREVLERCTFSFGDSVTRPTALATLDVFEPVLAALLEAAEAGGHTSVLSPCDTVPGIREVGVADLVALLLGERPPSSEPGRALDDYIEAQVHGEVLLGRDAEALIADPSFQGTETGRQLEAVARRYGFTLAWHRGFVLEAEDVPVDFRGRAVAELAGRIASELGDGSGRLDAELIGRAARAVALGAFGPAGSGDRVALLQLIKQLWHVLVAYGKPAR